jgi:hypothetical protein
VLHDIDELEVADLLTVRPATLEIGLSIDSVVERAREVKVIVNQHFYRCAIFTDVCIVASSSNGGRIVHVREPTEDKEVRLAFFILTVKGVVLL